MASPGTIRFVEINAVPAAPPAGSAIIYVKTDNVVYLQDSNGIEVALGTASGITSLTGEATGTGPGATVITLSNSAVIGKVLTGFTSGPNSTVLATDTLIQAIQKLQAQVSAGVGSAITSLTGDVTGTGPGATAATVAFVGGKTAGVVSAAVDTVEDATPINTASTLVFRNASGNFSANEITADLIGNADTATTAASFSGSLVGDVTGTQGATVVSTVGSKSASQVSTSVDDTLAATPINTASTIVKRDASGNFAANEITADLVGDVTGAASANVLKSGDTITGVLLSSNTTQSTTKDTGSVILEGGLGVEKNINAGGTILGSNISGSTSGTNTGDASVTDSDTVDLTLIGQNISADVRISDSTLTSDAGGLKVGTVPAGQVSGLATVATTGAYSDLSGTPSSLPPSGTAGGDLSGSYPNPSLSATKESFLLDRANHTGTQLASTISDFTEAAQDAVGAALTDTATVDLTYNDAGNTISADVVDGSITNVKVASGIDASKISDGSVSNTEFQFINSLTSNAQTQINSKVSKSGDTMTGELIITGNNGVEFSGVRVNNTNLAGFSAINANADDGEVIQIAANNSLGTAFGMWQPDEFGLYAKRDLNILTDTVGAEIKFASDAGGVEKAKLAADGKFHANGFVLTTGTVQNVPTPVAGTDAANKDYVDNAAPTAHASTHLPSGSDPLATAAPLANLSATTTNDAGTAESFSKSDHSHDISTGAASTQTPDQSNAEGSSSNLARADHVHNIPSGAVVQIGTSNFPGASASFALADHVHSHGNQTNGALHAAATTSVNGFMSSTDKTKLDNATDANTPSTLVLRDASGDFAAGTITANLTGAASDNLLKAGDTMTGYFRTAVVALTDAANISTDAALGNIFTVTIAGNRTFDAPTNPLADQKITYKIRQDAVGGRVITWDAAFNFGVDLSGVPNSTSPDVFDYYGFQYNSVTSKWDCLAISRGY